MERKYACTCISWVDIKTLNRDVVGKSIVFVQELPNRTERIQKQIHEHMVSSNLIRDSILGVVKLHIF